MRTVLSLLQAAEKLDPAVLMQEAMAAENSRREYVDLQQDQLFRGLRSDQKSIFNVKTGKDTYSPDYALYKGYSKPIDLKDKGDFYRGIFAAPTKDGLMVDSTDDKSNMLQERYGDEVFGLGGSFKAQWLETVETNFRGGLTAGLNEK